jgi:hypothetical protein
LPLTRNVGFTSKPADEVASAAENSVHSKHATPTSPQEKPMMCPQKEVVPAKSLADRGMVRCKPAEKVPSPPLNATSPDSAMDPIDNVSAEKPQGAAGEPTPVITNPPQQPRGHHLSAFEVHHQQMVKSDKPSTINQTKLEHLPPRSSGK